MYHLSSAKITLSIFSALLSIYFVVNFTVIWKARIKASNLISRFSISITNGFTLFGGIFIFSIILSQLRIYYELASKDSSQQIKDSSNVSIYDILFLYLGFANLVFIASHFLLYNIVDPFLPSSFNTRLSDTKFARVLRLVILILVRPYMDTDFHHISSLTSILLVSFYICYRNSTKLDFGSYNFQLALSAIDIVTFLICMNALFDYFFEGSSTYLLYLLTLIMATIAGMIYTLRGKLDFMSAGSNIYYLKRLEFTALNHHIRNALIVLNNGDSSELINLKLYIRKILKLVENSVDRNGNNSNISVMLETNKEVINNGSYKTYRGSKNVFDNYNRCQIVNLDKTKLKSMLYSQLIQILILAVDSGLADSESIALLIFLILNNDSNVNNAIQYIFKLRSAHPRELILRNELTLQLIYEQIERKLEAIEQDNITLNRINYDQYIHFEKALAEFKNLLWQASVLANQFWLNMHFYTRDLRSFMSLKRRIYNIDKRIQYTYEKILQFNLFRTTVFDLYKKYLSDIIHDYEGAQRLGFEAKNHLKPLECRFNSLYNVKDMIDGDYVKHFIDFSLDPELKGNIIAFSHDFRSYFNFFSRKLHEYNLKGIFLTESCDNIMRNLHALDLVDSHRKENCSPFLFLIDGREYLHIAYYQLLFSLTSDNNIIGRLCLWPLSHYKSKQSTLLLYSKLSSKVKLTSPNITYLIKDSETGIIENLINEQNVDQLINDKCLPVTFNSLPNHNQKVYINEGPLSLNTGIDARKEAQDTYVLELIDTEYLNLQHHVLAQIVKQSTEVANNSDKKYRKRQIEQSTEHSIDQSDFDHESKINSITKLSVKLYKYGLPIYVSLTKIITMISFILAISFYSMLVVLSNRTNQYFKDNFDFIDILTSKIDNVIGVISLAFNYTLKQVRNLPSKKGIYSPESLEYFLDKFLKSESVYQDKYDDHLLIDNQGFGLRQLMRYTNEEAKEQIFDGFDAEIDIIYNEFKVTTTHYAATYYFMYCVQIFMTEPFASIYDKLKPSSEQYIDIVSAAYHINFKELVSKVFSDMSRLVNTITIINLCLVISSIVVFCIYIKLLFKISKALSYVYDINRNALEKYVFTVVKQRQRIAYNSEFANQENIYINEQNYEIDLVTLNIDHNVNNIVVEEVDSSTSSKTMSNRIGFSVLKKSFYAVLILSGLYAAVFSYQNLNSKHMRNNIDLRLQMTDSLSKLKVDMRRINYLYAKVHFDDSCIGGCNNLIKITEDNISRQFDTLFPTYLKLRNNLSDKLQRSLHAVYTNFCTFDIIVINQSVANCHNYPQYNFKIDTLVFKFLMEYKAIDVSLLEHVRFDQLDVMANRVYTVELAIIQLLNETLEEALGYFVKQINQQLIIESIIAVILVLINIIIIIKIVSILRQQGAENVLLTTLFNHEIMRNELISEDEQINA